jgi:hypothetical protein
VERKVTNPVIAGKKIQTRASIPTIGNDLQQPVNQLKLQKLQVLNFNEVVIVIKIITLKTDVSRKR